MKWDQDEKKEHEEISGKEWDQNTVEDDLTSYPDSINPLDYTLTSYYPKTGPQFFRKINVEKEIGLNIVNFQSDYED